MHSMKSIIYFICDDYYQLVILQIHKICGREILQNNERTTNLVITNVVCDVKTTRNEKRRGFNSI